MAVILNIESSGEKASVGIARDGKTVRSSVSTSRNDHAAWIHNAISGLIGEENLHLKQLDAIAVAIGPGSYTGLRIGLSTAKGLCYALSVPLIAIDTLRIMAGSAKNGSADLYCPMIDARRMEVYSALYDSELKEILPPAAMVLRREMFDDYLINNKILFMGNGSIKFQSILSHANAIFENFEISAENMSALAETDFSQNRFADLAYLEPLYLKDFYSSSQFL